MMIGEWCSVIARLHLNVKQYLAKFLSEAGQAHIADSLSTDYNSKFFFCQSWLNRLS